MESATYAHVHMYFLMYTPLTMLAFSHLHWPALRHQVTAGQVSSISQDVAL